MMKPTKNETSIIGKWILENNKMFDDENGKRIGWLIDNYLKKVSSGNWTTLYQDPVDLRYWELSYPQGELQGGGPKMLQLVNEPLTKQQLRQQYLNQRKQLTTEEYDQLNQKILLQFQQLDLANIHCIHLFLPIRERREPDTYLIRDWLKLNHPSIKLVFPKTNFRTLAMKSYADDKYLQLAENKYGIPEPIAGNEMDLQEIDLVILPLLVFDKQGYRVGYGKGFYDRFTAQCKPGTQFIGISLFEPITGIEDVNPYDVWMHACLTPQDTWRWH